MKKLFFLFPIFLLSCGHSSTILQEESFDPPPVSNNNLSNRSSSANISPTTQPTAGSPCQGFIHAVVRFEPGAGAGFGQNAFPQVVFGAPQGGGSIRGGLDVLSLGDHGKIILDMSPCEITDKEGIDFIVFENAFWIGGSEQNPFAELGVVSVSEDGENFVAFPCRSATLPYTGCTGWRPVRSSTASGISPFDVDNAGGDPFDLATIGVQKTRYILIKDISGGGYPPSIGFDLDAIAVVNGVSTQ